MLPVLKANFTIVPGPDEPIDVIGDRIRMHLRSQVEALLGDPTQQDQIEVVAWPQRTKRQSTDGKTVVQWTDWHHPQRKEYSLTESKVSYHFKQFPWEVDLRFGTTEDSGHVSIIWRANMATGLTEPPRLLRQIAKLLAAETVLEEDTRVPFGLHQLTLEGIATFCSEVLWNARRRVPIIVVSPSPWNGQNRVDAAEIAKNMFGLAFVYALVDGSAIDQFKIAVGRPLACYDGAVRVYLPIQDPYRSLRHPYQTAHVLRTMSPRKLHGWLFETVRQISCHDLIESTTLSRLIQLRWDDEAARWRSGEEDFGKLFEDWERIGKENLALNHDKERLEEQISQKQKQWDDERKKFEAQISGLSYRLSQVSKPDTVAEQQCEQKILLSIQAVQTYEQASDSQKRAFRREIKKLDTELRKGQMKTVPQGRSNCCIFPQGDKKTRIIFYEDDGRINICELYSHHDHSYDNLFERGIFRESYPMSESIVWDTLIQTAR